MKVSKALITAYKTSKIKGYKIAQKAKLNPSTFFQIMNSIIPIKYEDERVLRIAMVLGVVAKDAFEKVKEDKVEK
ncbi:MAG: hypothetical protein ABIA04_00450 [Pseudomonadota bacterium]